MSEREIFIKALEIEDASERDRYVREACGDDQAMRRRVEILFGAHDRANSFLESPPPADLVPTIDTGPTTEKLGAMIGRYKLVHEMGRGGMGMVYMAVQKEPVKRKVALKVIKPGMDTREVVARFEAERQALALMDHPSIATVLDGGSTESGRPYFVMELVVGTPITKYCDECKYTTRQRLELFTQVCDAVQHAHQKGVIHRDIKPSNILVTTNDDRAVPKVIDFGIAKALHQQLTDQSLYTHVSQMIGTPLYMSPEQAQRTGVDVDTRTDVYSLGVLLYELLTGTLPFEKERLETSGLEEFKRIIREEEPPRPSTRLSTVDAALETVVETRGTDVRTLTQELRGELDWIVMKALEKNRSRRYESASDFSKDIQRYLNDEPVEACPPTTAYRVGKFYRRNKVALLTAVAFTCVLILGLAGTTWQTVKAIRALRGESEAKDLANERLVEVVEQRGRAEANFQKAIGAVDQMLTEVADEDLSDVPHMAEVRERLLNKALAFYQGLQQDESDDPAVQRETARAQKRCGDIYRLLGKHEDAEEAFEKSIERFEAIDVEGIEGEEIQYDLAVSLNALAALLRRLERNEEAIETSNRVLSITRVPLKQGEAKYRAPLAGALHAIGISQHRTGRFKEAESAYREAIQVARRLVAESADDETRQYNLAAYLNSIGILLSNTGRSDDAEASYREALTIYQQLAANQPKTAKYRSALTAVHLGLALVLRNVGRVEDAEVSYREALKIGQQLVADYPEVPKYRNHLASAHHDLASLLYHAGRGEDAEVSFREAITVFEQLASDHPKVPEYGRGLASTKDNLAVVLVAAGQKEDAEALYREALTVRLQLVADNPDVTNYRLELGKNHVALAALLNDVAQWKQAARHCQGGLSVLEPLAADFPEIPAYRTAWGHSLQIWAAVAVEADDREMEDAFRAALERLEEVVSGLPHPEGCHSGLHWAFHNFGHSLEEAGRLEEAETAWRKAAQILEPLVRAVPENAGYKRRLAEVKRHLTELANRQGTDAAEESAEDDPQMSEKD